MRWMCLSLFLTLLVACSPEPEQAAAAQDASKLEATAPDASVAPQDTVLASGNWRMVIQLPAAELPVQMEVMPGTGDTPRVYFINGDERVQVEEVLIDGQQVELRMNSFNTWYRGEVTDGVYSGTLYKVKLGATQEMPFTASHGERHRFFETFTRPEIDVSGRWEVRFHGDDADEEDDFTAVGLFEQNGSSLSGTFLTTTSDYRFLSGAVRGNKLYLSAYDGAHVFYFDAEMQADGTLAGRFLSGTGWNEKWTAFRNPDASLPDMDTLTYLKEGYDRFDFSFPNLDGEMVSLDDPRFQDKVVVVQLAGTWCPNCADETRFLAPWYKENRDRGVEVVGLLFEHFEEFEQAAAQVRTWRERWDVDYPTLVAGVSDKSQASDALPMLNAVLAYPTTIFIGRDGEVARIHNGFNGPATGELYQEEIRTFNATVDELLQDAKEEKD
ncbi:MAG: TlpA disulfide reductase family protein [Gammaproteobacteria bacterium]|nr:TlpA disulfide reductase family protein [Gammaproteobacteria bacterium]